MARKYWSSVCTILGLTFVAGNLFAQPAVRNGQPVAQPRQAQSAPNANLVLPPNVQDDIERIAKALEDANTGPDAATKKQREKDDLKAQQDMADWAKVMAKVAGVEALITFIGVILVGLTLRATKRAADAAEKTVEKMEEATRRELRAYVGIDVIGIEAELKPYSAGDYVPIDRSRVGARSTDFVRVRVRNFGQTPAFDTVVFCYWQPTPPNQRLPIDFFRTHDSDEWPTGNVRTTISNFLLQATKYHDSLIVIWDLRPFGEAAALRAELFLYGRVYYKDCFGNLHRTTFCFEWMPEATGGESHFIPYEEYNSEDDRPPPT
jgi:hypothetical protein